MSISFFSKILSDRQRHIPCCVRRKPNRQHAIESMRSAQVQILERRDLLTDISFQLGTPYGVTAQPTGVAIADFNSDGAPDLATATYSHTAEIRFGDGTGSFSLAGPAVTVGSYPNTITAADFNGDGDADLATCSPTTEYLSVRLGDGSGHFSAAPNVSTGGGSIGVGVTSVVSHAVVELLG